MKKFLLYVPLVVVLAVFGFFGKSQGDFFGINIAFGYGGGYGGGSVTTPTLGTTPTTVSGGNTVTTRNITLLFNASNATLVAVSESPSFSGASWRTYGVSENFTLSEGYGVKTLYVKFRSASGGEIAGQTVTVSYVAGAGNIVPPTQTVTTPAVVTTVPTSNIAVDGLAVTFRTGLTTAQQAGVTNLVNSGRLFSVTDAKNYAWAIGVSNWSQFVGVNPKSTTAAVATATNYTFARFLGIGSTGADVRALQQILKDLGYFTYPSITGYYGSVTQVAVVAYQKAKGLSPFPGFVGPGTRAALNNE